MKKYVLLLLLFLPLLSCSDDKADMPNMKLLKITFNGGEEDFSNRLGDILPLNSGDVLDVSFLLDGNGIDLKTFIVKSESDNISTLMSSYGDDISDDFSDLSKGQLAYKDGVKKTSVAVKLIVRQIKEEELKVCFYLNSKSPDCEGASYYLDLKTTTLPREIGTE